MRRLDHFAILLILLIALAVRLAYWQYTAGFGQYWLSMDTEEYYRGAQLFSQGQWLSDPVPQRYTRGPGYPLFLAAGITVAGPHIEILLLLQVMVSVLTVALVYVCARRALGTRAGLIAAALMAIAPGYSSVAASSLMSETLFTFFALLFLYLFVRWTDEGLTWGKALGAGMILGYAALIRPLALEFFPFAALWLLIRLRPRWRNALTKSALVLAGMLILILPYTLRNYVAYERVSLIDTANGFTLWNNHLRPGQDINVLYTIPNPVDREQYAYAQAFKNILADPVHQLLENGANNFVYLWHLQLQSLAQGSGMLMDVLATPPDFGLVVLDDLYTIIILLLAVVGLVQYGRRAPSLLLLWAGYNILVIMGTHAEARFRLPFLFVLVILAGAALASLREVRHWSNKRWLLTASSAVLLLACAYSPRVLPLLQSRYHLARSGGTDLQELQAAIDALPTYLAPQDMLGDAYRRAGQYDQALAEYARILKSNPEELQAVLGTFDIWQVQGTQAGRLAKRIDDLPPDLPATLWFSFFPTPIKRINVNDKWQGRAYTLNLLPTEKMGKHSFRWTEARSMLKFPEVNPNVRRLVLYGRSNPIPGRTGPAPVSVLVNGRSAGSVAVDSDWDEYELVLENPPRDTRDWIVELRSPVFNPRYDLPGSMDDRELGIMLSYAELR